jgi:cytochrome c peroxidase
MRVALSRGMQKKSQIALALVAAAALVPALWAAEAASSPEATPEDYFYSFQPLPKAFETPRNSITEAKVALGRALYHDPRLSKNHDVSCDTCHDLETYGVDNLPVSLGHRAQTGTRNSPTVYNAAIHVSQFWDGRSPDVEDQSKQPILNPVEMAMPDDQRVVATLRSMPGYRALFERAFPEDAEPITYDNMARAIGAFERGLVTPAPFDAFLGGETKALSAEQVRGFKRFVELGCASCHNGPVLGGQTHEVLGLIEPYPDQHDLGIYDLTKAEADKMRFKTPALRNVAKTEPYYHDGSIEGLDEAVRRMATHQLGEELEPADLTLVLAFLDSLTGTIPTDYVAKPELPETTGATPAPIPD